jgi:hypothetical protein
MKISELYPRRFARGSDLKGPATVTIKEITQEELHPAGRPVMKFVLWFTETPRGVILTRPLALQLAEILGDDTATWKDQKITLYPEPMNIAGRACVAIRARSVL